MSENTIDKHLKVKSMPSLCFNKDDFVSNEFSVDKFVSECRKYASLDTMRDDLNISHKILCTAMIELLNKDYADFVNLSSNLAGLDKSIKSLTLPLQSLKNEIEVTKENLDSTLLSVTNMFHERALVHCSKVLIHHLLIIEEGLEKINLLYINGEDNHNFEDIEILERIAIVFNNVQFHMQFFKKIVDCKNYSIKEEVVSSVAKNLEQQLQAVFLQSLSDDMHKQDLHKILRIYSYISEENKVEGIFRASVVRPAMKNLITQSNITKLGLEKVLNGILNFIPNSCNDVLKMTRRTNNDSEIVPGYDFLVNAVWLEIIDAFEYVAPVYLYSLGDPQQFHQNYCSFMMFLDEFEHICGNQTSVSKLREQSSYKEFIQKFNLDVYFQIRFQEIAGTFEHILFEESLIKETNRETDLPYSLKATVSLLSCINLCWSDSVYLPFLKKDFWRLTIQLIFRYNKYIHCCLKNIKEETFELALLIKDVETLVPELQTFLLETVEKKLECESFHRIVEAAVEEIVEFLNEIPAVAAKLIVKILVEKCFTLTVLATVLLVMGAAADSSFFTGAVYEHARYYSKNESAREIVEINLDCYRKATELASSKGADIIVFPEYGIFPPLERAEVKKFLETVPDPKKSRVNPCEERETYSQRIILHTLSCIAKNNSIVVVANMGDLQKCEGDPDCPEDGDFHFNANVAFDRDGTLLMKYHKEHLFYEFGMDLARAQQNSTFETDFGTFATYICFDIDFGRMSEVGQWPTVDAVLFSTMFVDQAPQMISVQFWESWALANNKTLLAANIQIPGYLAVGSGIFHGEEGALAYTFNPDGISKLVVARVPKRDFESVAPYASITASTADGQWEWKDDGKDVPEVCSRTLLNDSTVITRDYRCMEENMTDYTFVKLTAPKGRVDACNNGVCCFVDYETDGLTEDYYLGVFNGTYNHFGRYNWCEEDCVMARCDPLGDRPCATFPMKSETVFRHLHLKGNFTSKVIFPSVTDSGMRLVPRSDWHHHTHDNLLSDIHFDSESGRKLLVAGLKGRCYDKDPPYRR